MQTKVALLNAHNTLNYGTMMMCENVITHLGQQDKRPSFVVLADDLDLVRSRLQQATGQDCIEVRNRRRGVLPRWFPHSVRRVLDDGVFRYVNVMRSVEGCRVVVILGGDDLSQDYGTLRLMDMFLRLLSMRVARKKVVLLSQTIGPFTGIGRALAPFVLNQMQFVFHRGPRSAKYAQEELKCRSPQEVAADLAFLPLARESERGFIGELGLDARGYMVFVPSRLSRSYCADSSKYMDGLVTLARGFLDLADAHSCKVVVLPHVLRDPNDRHLVRSICDRLDSPHTLGLQQELLPWQARVILGGSRLNLSQRMHSAISSIQQGVPVVALSYSAKYKDVIGSYLGLEDLVVESDPYAFGDTVQRTLEKVAEVSNQIDAWRSYIAKALSAVPDDAARQLDHLAALLAES